MASKLVLNRLRSLCRVSQLSDFRFDKLRDPNSIFSTSQNHLKWRSYSEASQPTPINPHSPPPSPNTSTTTSSSLNEFELSKFSAIAETWWDVEGPFKPLHLMNPTRLAFIRSTLCRHFRKDPNCNRPFEGLKFVDVGCGGGILSEPLARMGAMVTGVDAVEKNIKIARLHVDLDPQTSSIEYRCTTAESLVEEQRQFDAVIALEVIEHVADPAGFCKSLSALTIPGGATVISTINRSLRAYATAIVAAEYLLHWLPKGTHQWSSFLTPEELVLILRRASITVQEMAGFVYNPLMGRWYLSDDIGVNFIAFGTKPANKDETAPVIAAAAYLRMAGRPPVLPSNNVSYAENLYILDSLGNRSYKPNPRLAPVVDILFILHAEHEMNCSTAAARHLASR